MHIEISQLIYLLTMHWVMDFIVQNDWMAKNKSSNVWALSAHVALYSIPWFFISIPFALVNGISHLVIDSATSKMSKYFFEREDYHNGFVVIGFDQLLHVVILLVSYGIVG